MRLFSAAVPARLFLSVLFVAAAGILLRDSQVHSLCFQRLSSTANRKISNTDPSYPHIQRRISTSSLSQSSKENSEPIKLRGENYATAAAKAEEEKFYLDPIDDQNKPAGALVLGLKNFVKQGSSIVRQALEEQLGITGKGYVDPSQRLPECLLLTLSNEAVSEAEMIREAIGGEVETNPASRYLYDIGCLLLDNLFDGRPIPRFWFLETIARVPYFSYVSMLHLYETFGWWREPELRKVHNAQEWNEVRSQYRHLHHLVKHSIRAL